MHERLRQLPERALVIVGLGHRPIASDVVDSPRERVASDYIAAAS